MAAVKKQSRMKPALYLQEFPFFGGDISIAVVYGATLLPSNFWDHWDHVNHEE